MNDVFTRLFHRFTSFRNDFDRQIESEIMASERLRAFFLSVVFAAVGGFSLVLYWSQAPLLEMLFQERYDPYIVAIVLFGYAAYEAIYGALIALFRRHGKKFPVPPRYANAVVEISFPTLILWALLQYFSPVVVFSLPPLLLYFLFIGLSALRLDPWLSSFTGLVAVIEYLALSLSATPLGLSSNPSGDPLSVLLPASHVSKALMILAMGLIITFVAYQVRSRLVSLFRSRDEQNRITSVFGQHVSPAVMAQLVSRERLQESEVRETCVLFLDIRNFTFFSQEKSPQEVVDFLNNLFDPMIETVNRFDGIINKFLGDGFMAVFGAPLENSQASWKALQAAWEIVEGLERGIAAGNFPATRVGIGLHTGLVVTGTVGSQVRQEYTVIGDTVNLASRIEQLNKTFGSQILASRETWDKAQLQGGFRQSVDFLGLVEVKGRDKPVDLVRIK